MAKIGNFGISTDALLIGGAVVVLGFAVYELLKPSPTNVNPSNSTSSNTNPQNTNAANPQTSSNPVVIYEPSVAPANSQQASVGSGSYYAIDYSPVSTYAPYTSTYSSNTSNTSNTTTTTTTKTYSPQNTYTASGTASSVYGAKSKTATQQPSLFNLFGGGATL